MDRSARWMEIAGWVYGVVGVGFVGLSFLPEALAWVVELALPGAGPVERTAQLFAAIAGGLTAGLGGVLATAARLPAEVRAGAARAAAVGLVVWFVADSAGSLGHGSWQNVLGNLGFLVLGLPPAMLASGWRRSGDGRALVPLDAAGARAAR
jgi:hypothetical protein